MLAWPQRETALILKKKKDSKSFLIWKPVIVVRHVPLGNGLPTIHPPDTDRSPLRPEPMPDLPKPSDSLLFVELMQRLHRFFHHLDERRYAELVAMFAQDGRWLRQGQWLDGHAAVRGALDARPVTQRVRHIISNVDLTRVDGDRAVVEAYMTAYRHDGPTQGVPRIAGPFRLNIVSTAFRRSADDWLIVEQRMTPEFEFTT